MLKTISAITFRINLPTFIQMKNNITLRRFCVFILLFFYLASCTEETKISFISKEISPQSCEDCPIVNIQLPEAIPENEVSTNINNEISDFIINILSFNESKNAPETIDKAILSFNNEYLNLKQGAHEDALVWEASITGQVTYQDTHMASIKFEHYLFTGGAHGYSAITFLNFDLKTGEVIDKDEIFNDAQSFKSFVEKKFRQQENIPVGESINSTGFMFEDDVFVLPKNIGFTEKGIEIIYNPYEVNVYSEGSITLLIPYEEANEYLRFKQ